MISNNSIEEDHENDWLELMLKGKKERFDNMTPAEQRRWAGGVSERCEEQLRKMLGGEMKVLKELINKRINSSQLPSHTELMFFLDTALRLWLMSEIVQLGKEKDFSPAAILERNVDVLQLSAEIGRLELEIKGLKEKYNQ